MQAFKPVSVHSYLITSTILLTVSACTGTPLAEDYPRVDQATGYAVDAAWPHRRPEIQWSAMPGIAVDAQDQIWTFNRGDLPVQVYNRQGELVTAWGRGDFKGPHQIRIDREGYIWLADYALHVVRKFTPDGKLLLTLGKPGEKGSDSGHFHMPTDVAISSSGDIFVADGYGNNRVVHFNAQGQSVKSWGRLGTGPGEFSLPHSIAVDSQGRLYVADRNNGRVQVFDREGRFIAQWRNLLVPWSIYITPRDEIYVCGSSPMRWGSSQEFGVPPKDQLVMKFTPEGRVIELWIFPMAKNGKERPGELNWVHGIAVDSRGDLYLGDIQGKRVQKFIRQEALPD